MITQKIFDKVLVEPALSGANKLYIVSGYATSAMAFHHLNTLRDQYKIDIQVQLIVGMCANSGLSVSNHRGFQELAEEEFPDIFECSYIIKSPPVHSKVYAWFKDDSPICAFAGSANYTQTAFNSPQREVLTGCEAKNAFEYFQNLSSDTIYCTHNDAENFILLYNDQYYAKKEKEYEEAVKNKDEVPSHLYGLSSVKVSLLDRQGNVQKTAGLNWGFRQSGSYNRNKNEAYIQLRPEIYRSNFFPKRSIHFTVLTDDNKILICTRAQKDKLGHAIETPHNNSLLGEYFRNRLGLPNGAFVTRDNFDKYGRTDVDFYKIDNETYYMDFSVS